MGDLVPWLVDARGEVASCRVHGLRRICTPLKPMTGQSSPDNPCHGLAHVSSALPPVPSWAGAGAGFGDVGPDPEPSHLDRRSVPIRAERHPSPWAPEQARRM